MQMDSVKTSYLKELIQLGDFLSVFLLTRSGLSYLTSEIFGGIILFVFRSEYLQLMEEKTKNLRDKFGCLGNVTWRMVNNENLETTSSHSLHVPSLKLQMYKIVDLFIPIYLSSYLSIIYLFIHLFRSNQRILNFKK